jgi:hypothetical protein
MAVLGSRLDVKRRTDAASKTVGRDHKSELGMLERSETRVSSESLWFKLVNES